MLKRIKKSVLQSGKDFYGEKSEVYRFADYQIPEGGFIGVLSDTHIPTRAGYIPPRLFKLFEGASLIIHAGDLVDERVFDELRAIAPVEAVAGNMDPLVFHKKTGTKKIITVGELKIGLMHGRGRVDDAPMRAYADFFRDNAGSISVDAIVFGHTHFAVLEYFRDVLMFNPGSPVEPRGGSYPSCGLIKVEDNKLIGEIIEL